MKDKEVIIVNDSGYQAIPSKDGCYDCKLANVCNVDHIYCQGDGYKFDYTPSERPIGDTFYYKDKQYEVVEDPYSGCMECSFCEDGYCLNIVGYCSANTRKDKTAVKVIEINNNIMEKKDLKPGMIVELANGIQYVYLIIGKPVFISVDGFMKYEDYKNDLTFTRDNDWDVVKVYDSLKEGFGMGMKGLIMKTIEMNPKPIWVRKETTLTMDEIAKRFNIPVSQLRIKK